MTFTLITGATGFLGKAFCRECAARGENLFLTARSNEKLQALADELRQQYNVTIDFAPCFLQDELSRSILFTTLRQKNYFFSRLINVAGADIQKAFTAYTQEKLTFQIRVNFEAAVSLSHFILERRAPRLEIVTISSVNGLYSMPYFAIYSATKGAEINFFTALREELKGQGVKVTTVLPGAMPTRDDIKKQIEGQGLWGKLAAKPVEFVAKKSLEAVAKNKRICIPGFWNHALQIVMKVVPMSVASRFIGKRWSKIEKDAF